MAPFASWWTSPFPPPKKGATLPPSRLSGRSGLPEREQAAVQVEVTQGKDGHLTALVEAHRPVWEFVVAIHKQGGKKTGAIKEGGADEPARGGAANVSNGVGGGEGALVGENGALAEVSGGGGGGGDEIDGVHARLRRLQSSVLADGCLTRSWGRRCRTPPLGAVVVRVSTTELQLSLGHSHHLSLQLRRRSGDAASGERNEKQSAKAADARAFLMVQFMEARYGGGGVRHKEGRDWRVNSRLALRSSVPGKPVPAGYWAAVGGQKPGRDADGGGHPAPLTGPPQRRRWPCRSGTAHDPVLPQVLPARHHCGLLCQLFGGEASSLGC
jgi:hypothetical protein